jgi:hypothetical protein
MMIKYSVKLMSTVSRLHFVAAWANVQFRPCVCRAQSFTTITVTITSSVSRDVVRETTTNATTSQLATIVATKTQSAKAVAAAREFARTRPSAPSP